MRWFCPMSSGRESVVLSDQELDQARDIVIRILDLAGADPGRLASFLDQVPFDLAEAHELARQPLFMLSVLEAATRDGELLTALESDARITRSLIELTQARLAFHVAAGLTRPRDGHPVSQEFGDRARQKLRELSRNEETGSPQSEPGLGKLAPGRRGS